MPWIYNYEKAFGSVEYAAIVQALRKITIKEDYVTIIENIYKGDIDGGRQDTLPDEKTVDGQKDAQNSNLDQEEETGADQKQDEWMTSRKQQA
ncbi:hypothetical protein PoB_007289100 [Plakobranchus ocellatus]|uniref:Uncharacterized protein n=1 Tax=Plakobranchus ocellatus TaxID=259542 RepID=A0AAV4DQI8_9GAST|nr:hypothetical protein PoB_007289100 [Plakobranchus ocellatus]